MTKRTKYKAPDFLDELAKSQWKARITQLSDRGDIKPEDLTNLEIYCINYSLFPIPKCGSGYCEKRFFHCKQPGYTVTQSGTFSESRCRKSHDQDVFPVRVRSGKSP